MRHKDLLDAAIHRVVSSGWFVLGPEVERFEQSFASYLGANHCVGVANGTDAIELALKAVGVGPGQRVATVSNAGMYTSCALLSIGAEPYFMDVRLDSRCTTLPEVVRAIDLGVSTVVVTHLYGLACPEIHQISEICRQSNVPLLEDCAQAHGATVYGKRVGTFGDAACFSFYPTKNLGALGDGGAIVTNRRALAESLRMLRQYGWESKYRVSLAGGRNSRLDEMQAAILSALLPLLDDENGHRRVIAARYATEISNPYVFLPGHSGQEYVAHLYVIRTQKRDSLQKHLKKSGIVSDIHYPIPDHHQTVFQDIYAGSTLKNTEKLSREILTLPLYPEMTERQAAHVINVINAWQP
jgi:dTDP-4-amino-4,6-dideoxygalactose transaminase